MKMEPLPLKVKKLRGNAKLPFRASPGAAAYDLFSANDADTVIPPGSSALVPTGIAVEIPDGYVGLVFSRSGLGVKFSVSLSNSVGVIDSDYRGEVGLSIINHGSADFTVKPGDRLAQLMITPAVSVTPEWCEQLSDTDRGEGGFGSTGRR